MLKDYRLYMSNNCSGCKRIASYIHEQGINIQTINVDTDDPEVTIPIMIFPALLKNNKLIGYGAKDIINHLGKKH